MNSIRPATPADLPLILDLIRELAEYEREPQAAVATCESLSQHLFGAGLGQGTRPVSVEYKFKLVFDEQMTLTEGR